MKESLLSTAAAPPSVFLSDELLDKDTACRLIGGSKPIDWYFIVASAPAVIRGQSRSAGAQADGYGASYKRPSID
jgi:hypothetical protein